VSRLAVALVVTFAARAIPEWHLLAQAWSRWLRSDVAYPLFVDLVLLAMGLLLTLPHPRRSALTLGRVRPHWRGVLFCCGVPIALTAIIYPQMPQQPFAHAHWTVWAVSPLAQDLVFLGFLYAYLAPAFPGPVHRRVPIDRALVLTACCFALWHVPNLGGGISGGYVAFQVAYTFVGLVVVGLSRQWTGSILYATLTHSIVNAIAVHFG